MILAQKFVIFRMNSEKYSADFARICGILDHLVLILCFFESFNIMIITGIAGAARCGSSLLS